MSINCQTDRQKVGHEKKPNFLKGLQKEKN